MKLTRLFASSWMPTVWGLVLTLGLGLTMRAEVPLTEVLAQLDPATGQLKASVPAPQALQGIVSARATLPDGRAFAYLQTVGEPGVPILAEKAEAALLIPRHEITLTAKWGDGPFGAAALVIQPGTVKVGNTNKAYGAPEQRSAAFFANASASAGRYVVLTNVTFTTEKFDGSGLARVKADGVEVPLILTPAVKDRAVPGSAVNVYGVPVLREGKWHLLTARFLSVNNKAAQTLAAKGTCLTCHNPDAKMVGPAYRDVAARYRNDPNAAEVLTLQMEKGGVGKWGPVPMPALGGVVAAADRRVLAEWILGYRWDALLAE